MTSQTARAERKASNITAHQIRNDRSRADAAERREIRRSEGVSRGWLHNARLRHARLDGLRAKRGLKPYQMTMAQAEAFEGTSEEGGDMLTYRIPMEAAAFISSLPLQFSVTGDLEIKADFGHAEPAFVGMIDQDRTTGASTFVDVEFQIIDGLDGHAPAIEYQRMIRELHEHIATLDAEIVVDEAERP